jgi:hypothetical protein
VDAAKLKPCGQMVKLGTLDGGCVWHQQHERDQHEGRDDGGAPRQNSD